MVGFIFLTYRFLEPIAEFTEVLDQTQTAVAGCAGCSACSRSRSARPSPSIRHAAAGRARRQHRPRRLRYRSRGDDDEPPVLVDVTAHIPAGQQVAVVGETGSGKTTLGRLIARFADPTLGVVRIGGVPLTAVANDESAHPAGRGAPGAVPVRRHHRRQPAASPVRC